MALCLTHSEGDTINIFHQLQIPFNKIDDVIARLQQAKIKHENIILPGEKLEIAVNYIRRDNYQVKLVYDGPNTFNIVRGKVKDTRNLEPPSGGIAG
jgi:hypothetical protein